MVEVAGVIREVGLEDIEPAVAVVVGHADSHSGLLVSVIVVSAAGHDSGIGERAVVVVLEQHTGFGVHRDIDVRPPVVIEIVRDGGYRVTRAGLQNARLPGNIGKGAVSVVVIQNVRVAGKAAWAAHGGNAFPLAKAHVIGGG